MIKYRFFIAALVLLSVLAFLPKKKIKLRYHFQVGQKFELIQQGNQMIKQNIQGTEQEVTNDIRGTFTFEIKEINAGTAKLEVMYKSIVYISKSAMGEVKMDSESADTTMLNKMMKSICKKPFTMYMNNLGKIEKVEGLNGLVDDMIASLGNKMSESQKTMMRGQMEQSMGEKSFKSSMEMAMVQYPENEIGVGEKWTAKTGLGGAFGGDINSTWELKSFDKKNAKMSATSVINTSDKEKINKMGLYEMKTDLSGNQTTETTIDLKTGWATDLKINSTLTGNFTLLKSAQIPMDMEIPMEIKSSSSFQTIIQ